MVTRTSTRKPKSTNSNRLVAIKETPKAKNDKAKDIKEVLIPAINTQVVEITLVGDTPLICKKFDAKVLREPGGRKEGLATGPKKPKQSPEEAYQASLYVIDEKKRIYGFPATAFKRAAVEVCTSLGKEILSKKKANQAFFVLPDHGALVRIKGTPRMREDTGRNPSNKAGVVLYRAEFPEWEITLRVRLWVDVLSVAQFVNLMNMAGFAVGAGEWRPEKNGTNGQWHVKLG